jgi:hypothetical protein
MPLGVMNIILRVRNHVDTGVQAYRPTRSAIFLVLPALLVLLAPPGAWTQSGGHISGRVIDKESGRPLESANVFLSNTTRGSVTGPAGTYVLEGVPPGGYQLVASLVGYEIGVFPIQVEEHDTLERTFSLQPRLLHAQEVEVLGHDQPRWRADLKEFEKEFLGRSSSGEDCVFLNPEVLNFQQKEGSPVFEASTDSTLLVRNSALGYLLRIHLESFSWNQEKEAVEYVIYVHFEPLTAASAADSTRWRRNRRSAYRGSLRHFLHALVQRRLEVEGFFVTDVQGKSMGTEAQSILLSLPDGTSILSFGSILRIDYGGTTRLRRNYVRLAGGMVHLRRDGSLVEQREFLIDPESDWARDRVAAMLPLDYSP